MILHVISGLGMGGAERSLAQVAGALQARGMPQHVVCVGASGLWAERIAASGVGVTLLDVGAAVHVPRGLFRLSSLMRRLKPAVVQGWMYHGDLFAAAAHRISPGHRSRRLFWNIRASNTDLGGYGGLVALGAWLSAWPDLVIANSLAGLDFHTAKGYRPRRTEVIANGIDTATFRPDAEARSAVRSELGVDQDALVAILVARVDPMKDHATFLRAMALLPNVQGILVGAGTESLATPPNVRALGLRRDVERLYAAADIVVSASAFAEGFSNAIAEGMASGLVPVATDIGDAKLIVGDTGHVVAARDHETLAAALNTVADLPLDERRSRGEQARRRVVEQFGFERTIARYAGLYTAA